MLHIGGMGRARLDKKTKYRTLGDALVRFRAEVTELAGLPFAVEHITALTGIERNSMFRYEAGDRAPKPSRLEVLARLYARDLRLLEHLRDLGAAELDVEIQPPAREEREHLASLPARAKRAEKDPSARITAPVSRPKSDREKRERKARLDAAVRGYCEQIGEYLELGKPLNLVDFYDAAGVSHGYKANVLYSTTRNASPPPEMLKKVADFVGIKNEADLLRVPPPPLGWREQQHPPWVVWSRVVGKNLPRDLPEQLRRVCDDHIARVTMPLKTTAAPGRTSGTGVLVEALKTKRSRKRRKNQKGGDGGGH